MTFLYNLGILRNIVSEKEAYRKEMMAKGLIPMYMRVSLHYKIIFYIASIYASLHIFI